MTTTRVRPALFLDRDGTLIEDRHYLADPDGVTLVPGAAAAVREANRRGVAVVVVTNQSGIGRGLVTEAQFAATSARLASLLAAEGAHVDATYHCPHAPERDGDCRCRKPNAGLHQDAVAALGLDPQRSVCIGDRWRDVAPALVLGGRGVLVPGPDTPADDRSTLERAARRASEQAAGGAAAPSPLATAATIGEAVRDALAWLAPTRIAVLASGSGSNLQALLDHFASGTRGGQLVWVGSNVAGAGALQRAERAGVPHAVVADPANGPALLQALTAARADLLVLAGYLKLVPAEVVRAFAGRLLNVHPALLPAFGGPGMYGRRVHEAVLAHGCRVSGVTVHFVDEQYDRGPIAAQWPVPVFPTDDAATLAARVLRAEHALCPLVVEAVARGELALADDGQVRAASAAVWDRLLPPVVMPAAGSG